MIDIKLNPSKRIYFCSDNHLGSPNRNLSLEREKIFITWLDQIKTDAQAIFFLGDLFDFWFEYKKVVPKGFTRLFGKLAELSDSGIDLFFFVGNHDCWIGNYFEDELGINVFHKKVDLNIDNYNILIGHGDGLGPGDNKYKFLKLLFRNPILKKLFSFIHPDIGISLGSFLSQKNIPAMVYYPVPAHKQKMFSTLEITCGNLENTNWLTSRVISLPMHTELSLEQQEYIVETIKEFIKK